MRTPIRSQLMLPLLAVALAGLTVVAVVYAALTTRATTKRIEERLGVVVGVLSDSNYPLTDKVLRQMAGLSGAGYVLADPAGNLMATSDERLAEAVAASPAASPAAMPTGGPGVQLGGELPTGTGRMFHSKVLIAERGGRVGPAVLHVLFPKTDYNAAWRAAFLPPFGVGLAMLMAVVLVVNAIAGRVGRTLAALGVAVQKLADGEFAGAPTPAWDDETRDLADSINGAARRLEDYDANLRRTERLRAVSMLGAGLAHEMRNAATGCRLAIDLHAEGCRGAEADEELEVARRQLAALEGRLQQLLQMGSQPLDSAPERLDLSAVVDEVVRLAHPAARHAGIDLLWDRPAEPHFVCSDADHLSQAVTNLVLNALEAASRGRAAGGDDAFVRLSLETSEGGVSLKVVDTGSGPESAASSDCFDAFTTEKPEGVGLGLAVAKRVVEESRGRIRWRRVDGLTEFIIKLPQDEAEPSLA